MFAALPAAALLAAVLLAGAVLSPLVFQLLAPYGHFLLHRLFNRIAMISFLVATYFLLRNIRLTDRASRLVK